MPLMLFFPNPDHHALVKAYIHGHYRINRKTGDRHWVDSYTDKRPERGRTAFAHWQHRLGHFQTYLAEGKQREALHAFHDLNHADSHKLAVQLGIADADQAHDSKQALMAAVHERIRTKGKAYREQVAAQVKADWERKKATGTAGKKPVKIVRAKETPTEPWQMTRAEFARQENKPKLERMQAAMRAGRTIVLPSRTKPLGYTKPDMLRLDASGQLQAQNGGKWLSVSDDDMRHMHVQAGGTEPAFMDRVSHAEHVEDAVVAGQPVPAAVLAEYPHLAVRPGFPPTKTVFGDAYVARDGQWQLVDDDDESEDYDHVTVEKKNPAGLTGSDDGSGTPGSSPTLPFAGSKNSLDDASVGSKAAGANTRAGAVRPGKGARPSGSGTDSVAQTQDVKSALDGISASSSAQAAGLNPAPPGSASDLSSVADGKGTGRATRPDTDALDSGGDTARPASSSTSSVAAGAASDQGEEAAAWTGLTPKLRLSAVMFSDADMATGDGRPTARAKRMADGSWADLSESAKRQAMPYVRERIARNKALDPAPTPPAPGDPEPRAPQEALGYDPKAVKNTIGGVAFEAVRMDRPIPHWRLRQVATGETYASGVFPSASKSKLWAGVADVLRRIGPDEFARQFGSKPIVLIGATPADREAIAGAASGPKDGDINADGLVFRGGRWHREDPAPALDLTSETPDDLKRKNAVEAAKQAADAEADRRAKADQEREPFVLSGSSRKVDELEARGQGNLFDGLDTKPTPPPPAAATQPPDDLDPSSPNYRYRDTGYVPGSRKEDAANLLRTAKRSGARVRGTAIDWETLEANPREAKEVITKSHLFGAVDWDALKADGMEPAAGFLVDRVYAAVGKEPASDTPQARRDYATGLESLRDRMERCKTPDEVTKVLAEIKDEYEGVVLNEQEAQAYADLQSQYDVTMAPYHEYRKQRTRFEEQMQTAKYAMYRAEGIVAKKKGKASDAEKADLKAAKERSDAAFQVIIDFDAANPEHANEWRKTPDGGSTNTSATELAGRAIRTKMQAVTARAKVRNATENPLHRAWGQMGERFIGVMNYRGYKGSDAFGKHVANAKGGRITDWSWAEQSPKPGAVKGASEESTRFQLLVADTYERTGGRAVPVDSTAALKEAFKLREVQSGNWVLRDVNSAKFHTEQTARAFADLADLIGVPDQQIAMNGRLALAFGARGKGNAGFGGGARAHYEPVQRVINLTKMGGGGSLAHEWFHAFDNLLGEALGMAMGKDAFLTEDPSALPAGELRDAFHGLRAALHEGPHRITVNVPYSGEDYRLAQRNVTRDHLPEGMRDYGMPAPAKLIRDAGDVHAATQAVDAFFAKYPPTNRKAQGQLKQWRAIAAAYYGGQEHGGAIRVAAGPAMSSFAREATYLDEGKAKSYWSSTKEMAARAFQAWTEDRLRDQGRQSDYLSVKADNTWYRSPFGDPKPFPEGEERTRINIAFDRLMTAVSRGDLLAKALLTVDGPRYLFFKAIGAKPTAPDWLLRFPEVDR